MIPPGDYLTWQVASDPPREYRQTPAPRGWARELRESFGVAAVFSTPSHRACLAATRFFEQRWSDRTADVGATGAAGVKLPIRWPLPA